jgi:predicted nucleic acid-binding Zn ribbon protein
MSFKTVARLQDRVILRIAGEKYLPFVRLYQAWRGIVGDLLASRSRPHRFANSILYISAQSNAWLQELVLHKADILKQCRAVIPEEIKDIVFMIRSR